MADEPQDREPAVDDPQEEPGSEEPGEVKEPDNERWWENPGGGGEMH